MFQYRRYRAKGFDISARSITEGGSWSITVGEGKIVHKFHPLISLWISRYGTGARAQPFCQLRPPPPPRDVAHPYGDGLLLPNQYDKSLPSGDAGVEVEEIAQSDADAQDPRVRGSGTDWDTPPKTMSERFPPANAENNV